MAEDQAPGEVVIRPAHTSDVARIRYLVDTYSPDRRLLSKATVALYEGVQEFVVAEVDGEVVGCGALHVMWEDLAEVRTLAVDPAVGRRGIGGALLDELLRRARTVGVKRVFVLTFEVEFFSAHGFEVMENQESIDPDVFAELLRSHDEGVAEFLDLARVKPNTLGNTRMIRQLHVAG